MKRIPLFLIILAACLMLAAKDANKLEVHEWGTFTSIAGEDGKAMEWQPWDGPSDLPCFVNRYKSFVKANLAGTVRMETPVLYFYTPTELNVNVKVRFPGGLISEWYPKSSTIKPDMFVGRLGQGLEGAIQWNNVKVSPGAKADFPVGSASSHYYAARQTDSATVQVGDQKEKFLFYRGIASFPVPIETTIAADGKVLVKNLASAPMPAVILFENRAGKMGFRVAGTVAFQTWMEPPALNASFDSLKEELAKTLVAEGLHAREAAAMIETWRDSWFEEGTRVFYILPQAAVDTILPLEIVPAPVKVARVFVGRMELITAATKKSVKEAVDNSNRAMLAQYGRFLQPISRRVFSTIPPIVNEIAGTANSAPAACR